jgi:hypothetical protein
MDDDCGVRRLNQCLKCRELLADIILDGYRDTNTDAQWEGKEGYKGIGRDANWKNGRMEEKCKDLDDGQELV